MKIDYIECCAKCENITYDKNGSESCECSDEKCECHAVEQYKCPSYFDDNNILQDCKCGKCK